MNIENLVVLKDALTVEKGHFAPNKFYRCLPDGKGFLIHGEWFTKAEYNSLFETVHGRMMSQFEALGLIVNGLPVSKTKFTKLADIHEYGTGRKALKVWYFKNTRDVIWGFYPMQGNKTENAAECYEMFTELVGGCMDAIDSGDVAFGNCGLPLAYRALIIA